jgi:transposase
VYTGCLSQDDVWMIEVDLSGGLGAGARRRRSAAERRRVVEETLEPGASVAKVALRHGVNANQVFQWRRLYRDGKLGRAPANAIKLLPVSVSEDDQLSKSEPLEVVPPSAGAIHIELPGEIRISLEGSVDRGLVCAVLKGLRS